MKCISCETQIDPKWRSAIDKNECPFCGEHILNAELKEMLSVLHGLLSPMQEDFPEELDDWMLSNFNFIRTSSDKLVDFVSPELLVQAARAKTTPPGTVRMEKFKDGKGGEYDVVIQKNQSDEETSSFFTRAEAVKPRLDGFNSVTDKTEHYRDVLSQIKGKASRTPEDIIAEAEMNAEYGDMQELISGSTELANSNRPMMNDAEDEDGIPDIVNQLANAASNGGAYKSKADLAILRNHMAKKRAAQDAFESGDRPTDRSGKPAGFSRM